MIYKVILKKKEILILFSALLFALSYSTSPFSFFIYFAFVPFLYLLEQSDSQKEAIRIGYITGLIFNAIVFYWIIYYKFDSYLLNIILNPSQFIVFAWIYAVFKTLSQKVRLLLFPFLWTFLEYIREFGDLALNWLNIAYTQGNYLFLIQFADISGINSIVFWICFINLIIYNLIFGIIKFRKGYINYLILSILFILPLFYGHIKLNNFQHKNYKSITAAYLQPNVNSKNKWANKQIGNIINELIAESKQIVADSVEILIWPETAIPTTFQKLGTNADSIQKFVNDYNVSLITGILFEDSTIESYNKYNSTILFNQKDTFLQTYHKIKLVPIEETLPYPELYDYFVSENILKNFYDKGTEEKVFTINLPEKRGINSKQTNSKYSETNSLKFSTIICFESSFPSFVRTFVNKGARFLVVVTNDEWFGYSTQSVQHLITSRFRAIENRKSVIHCSNAGISSFVDFTGRFYSDSGLLINYLSASNLRLNNEITIFGKWGDWIGKLSTIFILISFILIFYKHKVKVK